jgi:hypothetical protein
VEGIGKTTFAAGAPKPIFIQTEDGLGSLNVDHFPLASHISEVNGAIEALYTGEHDFQTVVLDSVDWADQLIWKDIEATHDAKDLAYGKGATLAADRWRNILDGLNALRNDKGMTVILLGHSQIKRFDSQRRSLTTVTCPSCRSAQARSCASGLTRCCSPITGP